MCFKTQYIKAITVLLCNCDGLHLKYPPKAHMLKAWWPFVVLLRVDGNFRR
jgi:hypothetical protein